MVLELSRDATAHYFAGPWAGLAWLAPCFAVVGHITHTSARKLSLVPALIGTVPGQFVLAVIAIAYIRGNSGDLPEVLSSINGTDADFTRWSKPKLELYLSWKEADRIYRDCLTIHKDKFWDTEPLFRIQECKEYLQGHATPPVASLSDGLSHAFSGPIREPWDWMWTPEADSVLGMDAYTAYRPPWRYLERLEKEHQCSGWVQFSRPIWTAQKTKEACSVVAGFVMKHKVQPLAWSLLGCSMLIIVLAFGLIGLLISQKEIHM
jgi:hypothetical protein